VRTFQLEGSPDDLYFANFARVDEEVIFSEVYDILKDNHVDIGPKHIGPSEDFYHCNLDGKKFILFYDIDDGAFIHATDESVMNKIKQLFD